MAWDENKSHVLADALGMDDVDAFLHVAGNGNRRGDPGRRADLEHLSHGSDRDGRLTS